MKKTHIDPFWKNLAFDEMTPAQWESLCDGCGKCCLRKIEYEDTGEICYTDVACRYLDIEDCRCSLYEDRAQEMPDCLILTPDNLESSLHLLPETCAYRLVALGMDLPWWHHLVCGQKETVHSAQISVRDCAVSEEKVHIGEIQEHMIDTI
ncbi:MAG TPA: YcgN family cysteine cluster protein [Deltaproteobacteria bacterium]|mgnify:CR=1 FL=1|nr:YcgN family cysteine cluster protein [Deltaproteobacteria bacterium]